MVHFSYCFSLTLMHSLWQAALLLCLYLAFNVILRKNNPLVKRNSLFLLLVAQLLLSVSTFLIYYTGVEAFYTAYFSEALTSVFVDQQAFFQQLAPWLISVYMLLLVFKSTHLIYNWTTFKNNCKTSWIKPSIDIKLFTKVKSFEFGIRRKVTLWYCSNITTPMTFGFFKPVILLPVALLNHLSLEETETLIIHELTHIKSHDYFLNWLLIIFETIFFFNPFVLLIGKYIRLEREKNCDTQVLQFNYPAISYAETLLKTASLKNRPAIFFLAAAFRNTQLFTRIQFFTKEQNLLFHKRNHTGIAALFAVAVIVLSIFLLNLQQKQAETSTDNAYNTVALGVINTELSNHFSTVVEPLVAEASKVAAEASALAVKHNLQAVAAKALADLVEKPASETDFIEPAVESIATPVALKDAADDTKEITLKEENSATGKSLTKVYKMKFVNGEWKAILLWTMVEERPENDSCITVKDTMNYFNPIQ